jgi:Mn-dependent DtxR family transcriptional regulator
MINNKYCLSSVEMKIWHEILIIEANKEKIEVKKIADTLNLSPLLVGDAIKVLEKIGLLILNEE